MKNTILPLLVLVWMSSPSCTDSSRLHKINAYMNAPDTAAKSKYMAENFRSFFISKEGNGKNKSEALQSFQNWDGPMHPDIKIISYSTHDGVWKVEFNEQNDFTKPIGFPGWRGTKTFIFNSKNLIEETIYVPDSANLSYKPFLQPALNWLQQNMPGELSEVYQNGKLVQTEAAANKWKSLFRQWQAHKDNSQ